MGDQNRK